MSIILFSPLGKTDPIPTANYRDGSMLHICRVYKPDKVYLYMSQKMLEEQTKDQRFTKCLDLLSDLQGRKIEYEIIERPDLVNVQEFDPFYDDFLQEIKKIQSGMSEGDELYLNVSSGTPAMKSALLTISYLGEYNFTSIQVSTPEGRVNEYISEDKYDIEKIWNRNKDNEPGFEIRCKKVELTNLLRLKNEEIIKSFISGYDYHSACMMAEKIGDSAKNYMNLLEIARDRTHFKFPEVNKGLRDSNLEKEEKEAFLPQENSEIRKYFEYALLLDLKKKKKEYADFIRAISPLLMDLFELILKKQCGIDLGMFTIVDKNGIRRWDETKLKAIDTGKRIIKALDDNFKNENKEAFKFTSTLSNEHFKVIMISEFSNKEDMPTKADIVNTISSLRAIEQKIRNLAAHEILMVSDEVILSKTGHRSNAIMKFIKKAFTYAGINIKKEDWDSYERMNDIILAKMEK